MVRVGQTKCLNELSVCSNTQCLSFFSEFESKNVKIFFSVWLTDVTSFDLAKVSSCDDEADEDLIT